MIGIDERGDIADSEGLLDPVGGKSLGTSEVQPAVSVAPAINEIAQGHDELIGPDRNCSHERLKRCKASVDVADRENASFLGKCHGAFFRGITLTARDCLGKVIAR